tara:strand:- start:17284 stop:17571 length:288 start_codon:yes stop_codon:yes gene_type:complete
MITLINSEDKTVEIGDNGGGQYFLDSQGTIASNGYIKVLISFDGTNYSPLTVSVGIDLSITDDYNATITLPPNSFIKFDATSIGSTGVKINLVKV